MNFGQFIQNFDLDAPQLIQKQEKCTKKLNKQTLLVEFNKNLFLNSSYLNILI